MRRLLLLLALAALPACASDDLRLSDCRADLDLARQKRDAGIAFAAEVTCDSAAHRFVEVTDAEDFPGALRRDRLAFATLLADRCAGAGSETAIRSCILGESALVQTRCEAMATCVVGRVGR